MTADVKTQELNLWQKLAAITGEIGKIEKTGQSSGYGDRYNFIEYAAVAGRLRDLFAKYGVVIVPYMAKAAKQHRQEVTSSKGNKGEHVLIDFTFVIINADKPEEKFSVTWIGEATDFGDKATNKAATSALKYYLMRQFNISEQGDDPDAESPEPVSAKKTASPAQTAAQAVQGTDQALVATKTQKAQITALLRGKDVKDADFEKYVVDRYSLDIHDLTQIEADTLIKMLKRDASAREVR